MEDFLECNGNAKKKRETITINGKKDPKTNRLSPCEVTFCNITDDDRSSTSSNMNPNRIRKRLISVETDCDSIASSTTAGVSDAKKKYTIPDGGYGWVVVLSSFFISLIADGVSFSFGLVYTELLTVFNESPSKTSWVGSLFLAVPLMSGPILSNLVDKYGCRKMTMIGAFVSGTGFVLASMSNSIEMLYLTFGVIAGMGLGVGYVTAVVSIAFWFDKKRTFATGVGASGTGIGTFIYAPLTQFLIKTFGWRGAILIIAGTIYNICVCGALMRDPDWLIEENRMESRSHSVQTFSNSSVGLDEMKKLFETGTKQEDVLDTFVTNLNTEANQQIAVMDNTNIAKKYQSEMLLPTFASDYDKQQNKNSSNRGSWRSLRTNKNLENKIQFKSPTTQASKLDENIGGNRKIENSIKDEIVKRNLASTESLNLSEKDSFYQNESNKSLNSFTSNSLNGDQSRRFSLNQTIRKTLESSEYDENLKQKGISLDGIDESEYINNKNNHNNDYYSITIKVPTFYTNKIKKGKTESLKNSTQLKSKTAGNLKESNMLRNSHYLRNMRIHRNSINYRGAMLNIHRYHLKASSCPNIYRNSMTTIAREEEEKWYDDFIDIMKSAFDFSLFKDMKFLSFSMSIMLLFIWFIVPYFYITEYLLKLKYAEEDGARLISTIGVCQTIGMISLGWIGDKPWVNVIKTYSVCLIVCGISIFAMPFFGHNYPVLVVLSVIFGLTFASTFSFTPIILVGLVDLDEFTCAYGLILLVQGIGNLIGPPLASLIYDLTTVWDYSFYASGIFILISGLLVCITSILVDRDIKIETNKCNKRNDDELSSNI